MTRALRLTAALALALGLGACDKCGNFFTSPTAPKACGAQG